MVLRRAPVGATTPAIASEAEVRGEALYRDSRLVAADATDSNTRAFVSSVLPRTGFRRFGDCAYWPDVDSQHFQFPGYNEPDSKAYTKKCGHCFDGVFFR